MAEVALAVIPICLSAIHGASVVRAKLRILRRHDREVDLVRRRFRTQADNFQDELCWVLLLACEDQGVLTRGRAEAMVFDSKALEWESMRVEVAQSLCKYLGTRMDRFKECIEEFESTVKVMEANLSVFAEPNQKASLVSSQTYGIYYHDGLL